MGATSVFISLEKNGVISSVDLGNRALVRSCAIKLASKTASRTLLGSLLAARAPRRQLGSPRWLPGSLSGPPGARPRPPWKTTWLHFGNKINNSFIL